MKKTLVALLFLSSFLSAFSQTTKRIEGNAKNIQNEPVPHATVKLIKAGDSTLVKGEMTSANGRFRFDNIQNDTYLLLISGAGYKTFTSAPLAIDDAHTSIVLPVIVLLPAGNTDLKGVVVTAKRPLIEQDIDKTIVNVDAMVGSVTSNTLEVLEKTPGVTISNNGDISLNGKTGVLVLIDGRATYMSGTDLTAYLKSLPGGLLDKIELIDNPPAKYDAAGGAVINIRLKKNRIGGFTGNFSAGHSQGIKARSYETINLNYNHKKINLFGNISYGKDGNNAKDHYDRKFFTASKSLDAAVVLNNKFGYATHGVVSRLGMDYSVSPKTIIGFQLNLQTRPRDEWTSYDSRSYNESMALDSINTGIMDGDFNWNTKGANINFQHKLDDKGKELSGDLNYINYKSDGLQQFTNLTNWPDGSVAGTNAFKYDLVSDIDIYNLKADYVHPMKKQASFEAGIKSSIVTNDNDSRYSAISNAGPMHDDGRSNHFIYHENINSAYVNFRKNWKRIGTQLGLRAENTQLKGELLSNTVVAGSTFRQNFTDLFPSFFISYKLDSTGNNTLIANISRRINRPGYQQFNPFLIFRDNYSYTAGDPTLTPQYLYSTELRYQYKQVLNVAINYRRFSDVIFTITDAVDNIFITRPRNIGKGYMVLLITNVTLSPAKWWNLNGGLQCGRIRVNGMTVTERLTPSTFTIRINLMNQFTFKQGWGGELAGFYGGKEIIGQAIGDPRYRITAGIQKKIWKDKATVRITGEDILHTWIQKDNTLGIKQAESFHRNEFDSQRIALAFSWRFGKETFARKRRHNDNAADAEKGRVE